MANTSVTYTGDGSTVLFNVPFPYIVNTHIEVEVNAVPLLNPSYWTWESATQIRFLTAPADQSGILIRRVTPGDTRLVDFANGAVLTEADLDKAIDQVFYLAQESKENYAALMYAEMARIGTATGITSTTPEEWLASAVDTMLGTAAAATLDQGIADIAINGEAILDNAQLLQLLGDANVARTAFTLDETTILVDGITGTTLANKFAALVAADGDATALIATEATARIDQDAIFAGTIALIGAENVGGTAFILDTSTVKIDLDSGDTLATRFSALSTADGDNSSAITTEATTRSNADTAFAGTVALLGAVNGGNSAFILDTSTVKIDSDGGNTFATALARNAILLDVNGYITGYEQINNGTSGSFNILADKFSIVTPSVVWAAATVYAIGDMVRPSTPLSPKKVFECTTAGTSHASTEPTWNTTIGGTTADNGIVWTTRADTARAPFTVEGDAITMNADVVINGSLIVNGSITATQLTGTQLADLYTDTGSLVLTSSSYIRGGQTAYDTGSGFFLGYSGAAYKFSIGDGAGQSLTWDGSTLTINGDLFVGIYEASATVLLSAPTQRNNTSTYSWQEHKAFTIDRSGTVRVAADLKYINTADLVKPQWRVKKNGVQFGTQQEITGASYLEFSYDVTGVIAGDSITIELLTGISTGAVPIPYIKDAEIRGTVVIQADGGTVDTD